MKGISLHNLRAMSVLIALVGVLSIGVAACGGSGDSSSSSSPDETSTPPNQTTSSDEPEGEGVDVGIGKPIPVTLENLNLAFVAPALSLPGTLEQKAGVEKVADQYGVPLTTFDSEFDIARQLQLYQTVIDSGKYNAIVTTPLAANEVCDILSKTAPEKGIVVSNMLQPICNRELEPAKGDGLWAPGTLSMVGDGTNIEGQDAVADTCAKETGGGETVLLNGIAGSPNYAGMTKAYESAGMDIVANYATNYLPAEALEKTSAALTAHPDLKVIASTYPALTEGAIQAIKAAGKEPGTDVKLCSQTGGTDKMIGAVKAGEVTVDNYSNSEWIAIAATQSIIDAVEGKPAPRVIVPGENGEIVKSGTVVWPPVYTKATADQYKPTRSAG